MICFGQILHWIGFKIILNKWIFILGGNKGRESDPPSGEISKSGSFGKLKTKSTISFLEEDIDDDTSDEEEDEAGSKKKFVHKPIRPKTRQTTVKPKTGKVDKKKTVDTEMAILTNVPSVLKKKKLRKKVLCYLIAQKCVIFIFYHPI